jgi:hypothetical protein
VNLENSNLDSNNYEEEYDSLKTNIKDRIKTTLLMEKIDIKRELQK